MQDTDIAAFIARHRLPKIYSQHIRDWFLPVAEQIALQQRKVNKPMVLGINGAQGSGKTTLASLLVFIFKQQYQLNTVSLSLDDFYLTRQERMVLAEKIHPLMVTRGVPGTHDVTLAQRVLTNLIESRSEVTIPHFDKAMDDRCLPNKQDSIKGPIDIIVLEGWCLGAEPQSRHDLLKPVNSLEAEEDSDGGWRDYVNQQLQDVYPELFNYVDTWIMLKAPSFNCVFNWRLEQENKLRESTIDTQKMMDDQTIKRFIQHYQRITESLLDRLPDKVDYLFELDDQRNITKLIS